MFESKNLEMAEEFHKEMLGREYCGEAPGGVVKVCVAYSKSEYFIMKKIEIDDSLYGTQNKKLLEGLIVLATNMAIVKFNDDLFAVTQKFLEDFTKKVQKSGGTPVRPPPDTKGGYWGKSGGNVN